MQRREEVTVWPATISSRMCVWMEINQTRIVELEGKVGYTKQPNQHSVVNQDYQRRVKELEVFMGVIVLINF